MKTIIIIFIMGLLIGPAWAQEEVKSSATGQDKVINLENDHGNPSGDVKPAIKDTPIVPSEKKLEVVPIPGRMHKESRKTAWGSAANSGAPALKKPLKEKVKPDRQKIQEKFADAPVIRMPEK
jgi:hypothetical protein